MHYKLNLQIEMLGEHKTVCFPCQKGSGHIGQKHWQLLESFPACRCTASMLLQPTLQAFLSVHKLSPLFLGSGSFCIRYTKLTYVLFHTSIEPNVAGLHS